MTRHFDRMARDAAVRSSRQLLPAPKATGLDPLLNRAFHCPFQDLLPRFAERSIQVLSIHPPYAFGVQTTRTYRSGSARGRACDAGDDPRRAMDVAVHVLRNWQSNLATGGVLLLWQPWQALLRPIAAAVERYEWAVIGPIVWDKGRPQPGRFNSPYSVQGEMLWVLHRPGDALVNHEGSARDMILRFPPVSFPGRAHRQAHGYEKPVALCEHLVRKHSRPEELVFDACGCTGSMSVAAIRSRRQWVYAESNVENFPLGTARIAAEGEGLVSQGRLTPRKRRVLLRRHVYMDACNPRHRWPPVC